jgi:DNA-binding NtrC family response regulator
MSSVTVAPERVLHNSGRPPRILIVEDDFLIRDNLTLILEGQGAQVVGPAGTLERGVILACSEEIDGAILDIRLGDDVTSFPIAEILAARTLPFIFMSGYGSAVLPPELSDRPLVAKPANLNRMLRIIEGQLGH